MLRAMVPAVSVDRERVEHVFDNLVGNALAHTPRGGLVRLSGRAGGDDSVTFEVEDSGEGIAPEHLARIFEKFYRVPESKSSGAGLGLAIVLAAATLSGLEPGMHSQAVWPFTWRPSFDAATEDADIRREIVGAALALGGAALLLGAAILLRHWLRWIAVLAALALASWATPHLEPLLVNAYPTSYFHSPTGFSSFWAGSGACIE